MNLWKEKVAEKLSRLLADSPSSPPNISRDSPVVRPEPQGTPLSAEELSCPESPSISSYLFSFVPTAISGAGNRSNKPTSVHGYRLLPLPSLPSRWKSKSFTRTETPLDFTVKCKPESQNDEAVGMFEKDIRHAFEGNINGSDRIEEACSSNNSGKYLTDLLDESTFISPNLFEFLQSCLPNMVRGCQWILLYSTLKHGISLRTLLRRSTDIPGTCLLIVGDKQGAVFGGLLDSPLKPTAKRKYQGTSQTFVFTTIYGEPRLFRATGANRYYYLCLNDLLAFGGGGSFALCLDEDLLNGTSGPCETFGNSCLAHSPEFELKNVELWGFTHSSRYLT